MKNSNLILGIGVLALGVTAVIFLSPGASQPPFELPPLPDHRAIEDLQTGNFLAEVITEAIEVEVGNSFSVRGRLLDRTHLSPTPEVMISGDYDWLAYGQLVASGPVAEPRQIIWDPEYLPPLTFKDFSGTFTCTNEGEVTVRFYYQTGRCPLEGECQSSVEGVDDLDSVESGEAEEVTEEVRVQYPLNLFYEPEDFEPEAKDFDGGSVFVTVQCVESEIEFQEVNPGGLEIDESGNVIIHDFR